MQKEVTAHAFTQDKHIRTPDAWHTIFARKVDSMCVGKREQKAIDREKSNRKAIENDRYRRQCNYLHNF